MPSLAASEPPTAPAAAQILVVDDQRDIREPMAELLRRRGYGVRMARDGGAMRACLAAAPCDLVLLDVMLPDASGVNLCRELQQEQGPPVILLTALAETPQRVQGLDAGAEDYITKPFEPIELLARVRAVLRRVARPLRATAAQRLRFEGWTLDLLHGEMQHEDGQRVALSTGEARLLKALAEHPQQVLSRERLLALCAGEDADVFDRSIDSHISRLRRKLEAQPRQPRLIKTAWGSGYLFAARVAPA